MNSLKLVWFILQNANDISAQVEQLIQFIQDMIERYKSGDDALPTPMGEVDFEQAYPALWCICKDPRWQAAEGVGSIADRLGLLKSLAQWIKDNPETAALLLQLLKSLLS